MKWISIKENTLEDTIRVWGIHETHFPRNPLEGHLNGELFFLYHNGEFPWNFPPFLPVLITHYLPIPEWNDEKTEETLKYLRISDEIEKTRK